MTDKLCSLGLICLSLVLFLSGCAERSFKKSALLLGTEVEITVFAKNSAKAERAIEPALKKIRNEEKNLSYYLPTSAVAKINQNAGKRWVKISPQLFSLIKKSLDYSRLTNGAFDIAYSSGGYQKIILDQEKKRIRFRQKGMVIDLGGIAKGYIVDEIVKFLQKEGIKKGIVNAGGDLKVFGEKNYRIAIRNPFKKKKIFKVITVKNKAVCTSGLYERPGHIRNPRTDKPISNSLRSVTIIAPDALTADTLATGVMVMGKEKGEKLLKKLNFSYFLIDAEGKVTTNNNALEDKRS